MQHVRTTGLALRPYFNRYTEGAIDLCDVLASFSPQNKASLHEAAKATTSIVKLIVCLPTGFDQPQDQT